MEYIIKFVNKIKSCNQLNRHKNITWNSTRVCMITDNLFAITRNRNMHNVKLENDAQICPMAIIFSKTYLLIDSEQ